MPQNLCFFSFRMWWFKLW